MSEEKKENSQNDEAESNHGIKRPVGNKPDRFKEIDLPFVEQRYPADSKVVPKGKLFEVSMSFRMRAKDEKDVENFIKITKAGNSVSIIGVAKSLLRSAEVKEIEE